MKKAIILSLLLFITGIVLFSCGKTTEPVGVDDSSTAMTIQSRDAVSGGIRYRFNISIDSLAMNMNEASFCIGYDKRRFSFFHSSPGNFMLANEWQVDSCVEIGSDPLTGDTNISFISIHLIKDTLGSSVVDTSMVHFFDQLYQLQFDAINDISTPITNSALRFYWSDCNSNLIYFSHDDKPARIGLVRDADSHTIPNGLSQQWFGPSSGCESLFASPEDVPPITLINGVETIWADTLGGIRGNINMNDNAYEIADAVMFTNYFIVGEAAFGAHADSSILASDVNANSIPLELADMVYLIRIIIGDAYPFTYLDPSTSQCTITTTRSGETYMATYSCPEDLGAVLLRYRITGAWGMTALDNDFDLISIVDDSVLSILVYNIGGERLPAGQGAIARFVINGTAELISAEVSSYEGVNIPVVY